MGTSAVPHCSAIRSGNHARTSSLAPVTAFCDPLLNRVHCPNGQAMLQATQFMSVLDRINNVGMAVQILDAMKNDGDLKDTTRVDIIRLLLASPSAKMKFHT